VSTHYHAVVWIDHHEARVFHFNPAEVETLVLHPHNPTRHIHHKANSIGSGHAAEDHAFLQAVTDAVADAGAILITGPANAKTELVKHIHSHRPTLMRAIAAVETVDHPSDAALVAYASKYFAVADRMSPQR
jgi:stalled ribosome rescue protein Dom34